ncbi:MAG: hypothetical protein GX972_03320 [Amphibacillus sp.]|uniref:DUF4129 domain-containing protein n=1 Tax=Amphibacillus xylanus (strain ATCC 51415 / DSM 6626 / JCM 7361 / LMG 17667 / NBRC 15112 / Ep01) TaxID=698758 RepID=K0IW84_AMPXN|nr:hypothetical protein [Amphibacillus xylanus]NMA90339.1 hypothetical protein [Amphibacillus sp.]BAM46715.1 hypothetical protein AXY_05830 [Amphibacillus xylanus NBRC 15112]
MTQVETWHSTLEKILNSKEYQAYYQDNRNILQRIWDYIKEWVLELINKWFDGLTPSSSVGDLIVAVILIVLMLVVVCLAIYLIRNFHRSKQLKRHQPLKEITINGVSILEYQNLLEEAELKHNYQASVRFQFLILLYELDQMQWLKVERWKTNWDYYQEIKSMSREKAEQFYQLAIYFEATTYGNRQVDNAAYEKYVKQVQAFKQEE